MLHHRRTSATAIGMRVACVLNRCLYDEHPTYDIAHAGKTSMQIAKRKTHDNPKYAGSESIDERL